MKTTKTVEVIHIDGNVLAIKVPNIIEDEPRIIFKDDWYYSPLHKNIFKCIDDNQTFESECKILASKVRISPSIPLIREESLIVKDRFILNEIYIGYPIYILDTHINEIIDASFEKITSAQNYCNYLNRQHEQVDVEKLADVYAEKHAFRVPYDGSNKFYDEVDFKCSKEGFIAGRNSAPKGGYSEDDMRKAIWFGYDWESSSGETHKYQEFSFETALEKYMDSLKPKPTTITIYEVDGSPLIETIDGVEYIVTQ